MEKTERDNLIDELREMDTKLSVWLAPDVDLDAMDRQALEQAKGFMWNVQNRLMGKNYQESRPFKPGEGGH